MLKPTPYVEITVDDKNPLKTETVKTTTQPKWNETFTLLVTPQSKINFAVKCHNSIRKDTTIGEKKVDLIHLLYHFNGKFDDLDITLDLMSEKQTGSPVKVGELVCSFRGLNVDMSNYVRINSSTPLAQSNSGDLSQSPQQHRGALQGIRAKVRNNGSENVMPPQPTGTSSSRANMESRQLQSMAVPFDVAVSPSTMAVSPALALSPSTNNLPNGKLLKNTVHLPSHSHCPFLTRTYPNYLLYFCFLSNVWGACYHAKHFTEVFGDFPREAEPAVDVSSHASKT